MVIMKKLIFPLILLFFTGVLYSQSKYGNATKEELEMTSYPNDTTASAVILLKQGETQFTYDALYGFRFEYAVKMKIKILTNDGLEWCTQQISYYEEDRDSKEEIRGLSGTTYNLENGKIVKTKLSKEYIFDEDTDKKWKIKKFTFPGAKVGSVIEFKYSIFSDFFYDLRDFTFQSSIPTSYVSYEIIIPEYYRYNVNMQGFETITTTRVPENKMFHITSRGQTQQVSCTAEKIFCKGVDVPALKKEPYVWSVNDYVSQISFELKTIQYPYDMVQTFSSTWENIDKMLKDASSFGGNLKRSGLFKNEITKTEVTLEKASEVLDIIKNKVKWNDRNSMGPDNLKDVLKNGIGNNADINFLLINALNAAGFDAYPVILRRRESGQIPFTHPSITAFNYCITGMKIDTVLYFVDASDKYSDWNLLPAKCMVTQARMMNSNPTWVDLSALSSAKVKKSAEIKYEGLESTIEIQSLYSDVAAYNFRKNYAKLKDQGEFLEKLSSDISGEIEDLNLDGIDNNTGNIKLTYKAKKNVLLMDEFLYITPLVDKLYSENPFQSETRNLPINFDYLTNYLQIVNITIPEGYVVEELPKSEKLATENNSISLTYRVGQVQDKVSLNYSFRLNKLLFLQDDYETLRNFFAKLILKNSEQIVLKKVAE